MYITLVIVLIIAILAVIFGIQNTAVVTITFLGLNFNSSLALVILLAVIFGFILTILFSLPYFYRFKKTISKLKKEITELKKENEELKDAESKIKESSLSENSSGKPVKSDIQ